MRAGVMGGNLPNNFEQLMASNRPILSIEFQSVSLKKSKGRGLGTAACPVELLTEALIIDR